MKIFFSIVFIQLSLFVFSSERGILIPEVMLISSEKSDELNISESMFVFQFTGFMDDISERIVLFSLDGKNNSKKLNPQNEFSIHTIPGIHSFQFFYNDTYYEIYADSLDIKDQFINTYAIRFESSEFPVLVDKPVIYLYPENVTQFSVTVLPKGKMAFTYPTYNGSWNGNVLPNGEITIENEKFNYLFWEADQKITNQIIDPNKGSIISGNNAVKYLTKQLNSFGLNSKEKADFITFWGPKLAKNEYNYVYFVLNNEADYFSKLSVAPSPDNIYRLYILTCPIVNPSEFYYLEPQLIESIIRKGFTVIEWGGSVIDTNFVKKRRQVL